MQLAARCFFLDSLCSLLRFIMIFEPPCVLPPSKKQVMFSSESVCLLVSLSVCLAVRWINQKVLNGF